MDHRLRCLGFSRIKRIPGARREILETEMIGQLGAAPSERSDGRLGYRAGNYPRNFITRMGKLDLSGFALALDLLAHIKTSRRKVESFQQRLRKLMRRNSSH